MFERCCAFCEASTEVGSYGQVDHYRPKSLPQFRALAYSWENLLWVCGRCNVLKGEAWNDQTPALNPCDDDPKQHLQWREHVVTSTSPRGGYTVGLLGLDGSRDRLALVERRRDVLRAVRLAQQTGTGTAKELLSVALGPGGEFRGMLGNVLPQQSPQARPQGRRIRKR